MKEILVIDNYDSFTYNLVHILRELGFDEKLEVVRNDTFSIEKVDDFEHILLSPGPGLPRDAGLMTEVVRTYAASKNILGVCLGHQGVGEVFGCELYNLPQVYHGVVTKIEVTSEDELFAGLPNSFSVCRYHSWVIKSDTLSDELEVTSVAENGNIMSIRHKDYKVRGVQFHPESIMTEYGKQLIQNWLAI